MSDSLKVSKRLDQPTDLEAFMERIDKNGKRIPTRNETENSVPPKPLLPQWLNNILVIVCTVFSTLWTLIVLLLLTKHFKMKSLIASLVLSTLPPPPEATAMRPPPTGQFDLPGLQVIGLTLEHYLSPEKMTFNPFLYKNCKNIVNVFLKIQTQIT